MANSWQNLQRYPVQRGERPIEGEPANGSPLGPKPGFLGGERAIVGEQGRPGFKKT